MKAFLRLFGGLLVLVYHCFDRIVIFRYLPLLFRPEHIVYFCHDVRGVGGITKRRPRHHQRRPRHHKEVLGKRIDDYQHWIEAFARNHLVPLEWAEKGVRKEDYARPARFQAHLVLGISVVGARPEVVR